MTNVKERHNIMGQFVMNLRKRHKNMGQLGALWDPLVFYDEIIHIIIDMIHP
jgi:hypothetical protein